jgi:hypothetical protein
MDCNDQLRALASIERTAKLSRFALSSSSGTRTVLIISGEHVGHPTRVNVARNSRRQQNALNRRRSLDENFVVRSPWNTPR